jgi:hypothetical protein
MSFCNSCNFSLKDSKHTTKLIHDIIFHQETFETQEMNLSKEQIIDAFCNVTKILYFDEQ